jgi:hypothetical protein
MGSVFSLEASGQPRPSALRISVRGETGSWDSNREVAKEAKVLLDLNPRESLRPSRLRVSELKFQAG